MAIEYLLVTYPEQRAVLADGNRVGFTNHTFMLPTDEYLITLEGSGYAPPNQDVPLSGTSLVKPMVDLVLSHCAGRGRRPSVSARGRPRSHSRSAHSLRGQEEKECLGPRRGSSPASCSRGARRHASRTSP